MVMVINPPPLAVPEGASAELREYIEYLNILLRQISQAIGPRGVIGVENGGTNITEYTIGDLLVASAPAVLTKLLDVAAGNALLSGGAGALPFYGKVGLTTHIDGILSIANGGTNRASIGSANQISGVNVLADAIEYKTLTETANRTTIVHGIGSVTFDISATYVGQTSIATLGTVTTGTWDATTIAASAGGTGHEVYVIGDILYASSTTSLARLAGVVAGNVLKSGGVGTAPLWGKVDLAADVTGVLPAANGGTDGLALASGRYTPTLTNVANLDGSTAYECQYLRVGSVVTVSGRVDINPTLAATSTQLGISLPVASNIGAVEDCAGAAFASGIAGQGAAILGDAANNRAQLQYIAGDVSDQAMYFTFTYEVI
jgi:hypothetical protein